jgi:hypothetical protein
VSAALSLAPSGAGLCWMTAPNASTSWLP